MPESPTPTATDEALLTPEFLSKLDRLELASKRIVQGRLQGERRSRRKGSSVEFADYRNYSVGDDLRRIDWNIYSRLEKLFLKLFLEEEDLRVHTLIDTSLSMNFGTPTKLLFAKKIAAALSYIGMVHHDRVTVEAFAASLEQGGPGPLRSKSQIHRLLHYLESIQPSGASDLTNATKAFATRNIGPGVVVVVSDFLDKNGYETALRYLVARNFDVYVIHVLSQEEINPPQTGDLRLVDAEDGDFAEITITAPLLERYKHTLDAFKDGLRDWCSKRGIHYTFTTSDAPFERLVLEYMRRNGLVR
ncbi:MAG: DUF58 domain-containing protein [Planctomycetota bacterium]